MTHPPGIDFVLLRTVLRKHALLFCLLLGLGVIFLTASLLLYFHAWLPDETHTIAGIIGIAVFFLCGLFLVGFAVTSNISSVRYYYASGLLRQHGVNTSGTVLKKTRLAHNGKVGNKVDDHGEKDDIEIDELELRVHFHFDYAGQRWEGEDLLNQEPLFDALTEGQTVPLRMLPWAPSQAMIRQRTLLKQVMHRQSDEGDEPRIGQPLMDGEQA
ncbi:hypothetical protein [Kosakonia sp.]|uniref:hypothetical protein n=1 Tax=Kosakonia sp. TaxID=1916651 RepID=UPI0028A0805E|nr:hypothetical protein [Kosakonia sp.]